MTSRRAAIGDVRHLVRFAVMKDGGCSEALYEGLMPDQSIEEIHEPYFCQSGAVDFYDNHWIDEQDGRIAGGIHAFPFDDFANDTPDPRVPEERYAILQPFDDLPAPGSYFVNALSVYTEYRRRGIASSLLSLACRHAVEKAFNEVALWVFAENAGAVVLYEKSGFKVVGREPVVEHPLLQYSGEVFLMSVAL